MTVQDVIDIVENWAPPEIAWEKDNSGLQCGSRAARVRGILVALDPTLAVAQEAHRFGANMIVTHHPLLFHPLRSVDTDNHVGRMLSQLLKQRIALYGAHTTLDFTEGGTSHILAERLGLETTAFLRRPYRLQRKLVTFVPTASAARVAEALAAAGAGKIGNYDSCSFRLAGTGTFRGNDLTHPVFGEAGRLEEVQETRLEMVVPAPRVQHVLHALRRSHPYEEAAYDLYPTDNSSHEYGAGVIGELPRTERLSAFLLRVKQGLHARRLRWCGEARAPVKRVAVCGGSGGELLDDAIRAGAQAFVTADVRYHAFHEAEGRIALIDAGHYETELPLVDAIVRRLRSELKARGAGVAVRTSRATKNPVQYS